MKILRLCPLALLVLATGSCGPGSTARASGESEAPELLTVSVVKPERKTVSRTTTQPAAVSAYFAAEVRAKTSGYLRELAVDIGDEVEEGAVLGVLDVPEMDKRRERQAAVVRRLEAAEQRAAADIAVAEADLQSHQAMVAETRAVIREREADLQKHEVEHQRVQRLVQERAGTQQELDLAEAAHESSKAAKATAETAADAAEANVALAAARLNAAQADLDNARAETDVARRELEELDALASYAVLRAPFRGVVVERNVDPGDLVPDTSSARDAAPLFVVAQLERVRVRVPVPERDAPWVDVGDRAIVTLQAMPGTTYPGQVDRLSRSLHESTRTMLVEVELANADRTLLPGMFGEATIVLEEHEGLVLPAGAVQHDESGHSRVYAVDEADRVQLLDVVTGLDTGQEIEVTDGLSGDERIVLSAVRRPRPGTVVRVGS